MPYFPTRNVIERSAAPSNSLFEVAPVFRTTGLDAKRFVNHRNGIAVCDLSKKLDLVGEKTTYRCLIKVTAKQRLLFRPNLM